MSALRRAYVFFALYEVGDDGGMLNGSSSNQDNDEDGCTGFVLQRVVIILHNIFNYRYLLTGFERGVRLNY